MADRLKIVQPNPAVPVDEVKSMTRDITRETFNAADDSKDESLDKKSFWAGFAEKCAANQINPLALYKCAQTPDKTDFADRCSEKTKIETAINRDKQVPVETVKTKLEEKKADRQVKVKAIYEAFKKQANWFGALSGAGLGSAIGGMAAPGTQDLLASLVGRTTGLTNALKVKDFDPDLVRVIGKVLGGTSGAYLGDKVTEDKQQG